MKKIGTKGFLIEYFGKFVEIILTKFMRRLFILLCYLLVSAGHCWAQNTIDEQIDALYDEFSNYEGADGTKLGPVMMKMAYAAIKSDEEVPEEQRMFFKDIKRMAIVDMSESPAEVKAKFKSRMSNITLEGFEKVESSDDVQATTFYHLLNGKVDILVVGIFEQEACSFSVYEGSFEEVFAKGFSSAQGDSPIRKQEQPQQ